MGRRLRRGGCWEGREGIEFCRQSIELYKKEKLKEVGRRLRRGGCWEGREGVEFDKRVFEFDKSVLNLIRNRN